MVYVFAPLSAVVALALAKNGVSGETLLGAGIAVVVILLVGVCFGASDSAPKN